MKCKNKEIRVYGIEYDDSRKIGKVRQVQLCCICSNDEHGKTLSVDNGVIQFCIPMEQVAKCFEGDYVKR